MLGGGPSAARRALLAAGSVLWVDVAGQNSLGRREMLASVITGALGAPFLLWMLVRSKTSGSGR